MAGLAEAIPGEQATGVGPFSRLARAQYAALAAMRWSMFRNSVRSTQGAIELGARTVSTLVFAVMGLGIAFGLGVGSYQAASQRQWNILAIVVWIAFLLWQIVPITLASFQQQFDMGGLLRFPLSFSSFCGLHILFGLVDISTIMGGFCCAGIWLGITLARPAIAVPAAVALLAFAAFNVLLVRAVFAWIDRWLAQRRTREMVMALFFIALLSMNFLNPAFRSHKKMSAQTRAATAHWVHTAEAVQVWLPAGAAAQAIGGAGEGNSLQWIDFLALLGLYGLAAGGVLAVRLAAEFRGESFGEAPARASSEVRRRQWLLDGSGPIAAVMEKELRTIARAVPLLYGLGVPLVMVFLFAGLFRNGSHGSINFSWGLLISVAYTVIGFTQLIYNNLGTEGAGIQILFLSPTPLRKVLLAKNLFHAALFLVDAALVTLLASWRYGSVQPLVIGATWAWVLFALPLHLAAGNLFSLLMPYRINLGRIGRQKGAQANALLSMVVQAVVLGLGVAVLMLCSHFAQLWVAIPALCVMAAASVAVWLRVLAHVDRIAYRRRDDLLAELVRTE